MGCYFLCSASFLPPLCYYSICYERGSFIRAYSCDLSLQGQVDTKLVFYIKRGKLSNWGTNMSFFFVVLSIMEVCSAEIFILYVFSVRTDNRYVSVSADISVYRPIIGFADMGKSLSVSVIGIGRYRMPYRQPYRYTHKHQS